MAIFFEKIVAQCNTVWYYIKQYHIVVCSIFCTTRMSGCLKTTNFTDCLSGQPKVLLILYVCTLLVSLHSILLGLFIYFFTESFYEFFFASQPENVFFVRQSGVFLFCLGVYYFLPLLDFQQLYPMVHFTIFTKIVAVLFLVTNANLSLSPNSIYMAALGDGLMATCLIITLYFCRKSMVLCKT